MKSVMQKIEDAFAERIAEGILPDLLIINHNDERLLFTEGHIPKENSAEDFFMDKYKVEMFVLTTKLTTEPEFYGRQKLTPTSA